MLTRAVLIGTDLRAVIFFVAAGFAAGFLAATVFTADLTAFFAIGFFAASFFAGAARFFVPARDAGALPPRVCLSFAISFPSQPKHHALARSICKGIGPPFAQSSNSTVWTTGISVPLAICVMQPMLPSAMISGRTDSILATLRWRNCSAK